MYTTMQQKLFVSAAALALTLASLLPAAAQEISAQEKMEICKFGAADQKLTGKQAQDFIRKCMANEPAPKPSDESRRKKQPGK